MLRKQLQKVAAYSAVLRKTAGIPRGARELAAKGEAALRSGKAPSPAQLFAGTRVGANRAGRQGAQMRASGDVAGAAHAKEVGQSVRDVSRDFARPKPVAPKPVQAQSAPVSKPGVLSRIANHFKSQAGKHGVLPVAGSIAGGAALMSSAAKAPSKYNQFKQGFRPENHQVGAKVGE